MKEELIKEIEQSNLTCEEKQQNIKLIEEAQCPPHNWDFLRSPVTCKLCGIKYPG